ncbi:succinate dehydrogenase assembly factor 2 [Candidatus Pelagibacter sp.]|nr:succinate dehydrogenase assembly factor 2 [Candidatus Pelagibacter sp.]
MTLNIDLLKKKIIYRSNYRGTKEMDKLLGSFTKKYIETLKLKDLTDLEKLLDIDDTNLYNYYNGLDCDFEFKENYINSLFKNFKYDNKKK